MDTPVAQIEFEGKTVGGTVIFGDAEAEPLLGVTALESGGFEVDPRSQQLRQLPAILLKRGARSCRRTSSIMVRVIRIVLADRAVPRIRLGVRNTPRFPSGSCVKGVSSIGGDQPHQIAGKVMTMIPHQKLGVARPMMAMVRPTWPAPVSCRIAE